MTPQELLLEVFCLVDDELQALALPKPRTRGPAPALTDAEVIAIELAGEFWAGGWTPTAPSTATSAGTTPPSSPPSCG